ncbi:MAG: enoyl-CoA hydratase-related protein [Deinococcales bacterium]
MAALVAVYLIRQLGERQAKDLLLSARLLKADEALSLGLINAICPAHEVLEIAKQRGLTLLDNAPNSLRLTKSLLNALPGMGLKESLAFAAQLNAFSRSSDDLKEGVSAFLEKREPTWRKR